MDTKGPTGRDGLVLDEARVVVTRLVATLKTALQDVQAGRINDTSVRRRIQLLASYQTQLKAVLDLEGYLDTGIEKEHGGSLDLSAARDEIRERLARIRERSGG